MRVEPPNRRNFLQVWLKVAKRRKPRLDEAFRETRDAFVPSRQPLSLMISAKS